MRLCSLTAAGVSVVRQSNPRRWSWAGRGCRVVSAAGDGGSGRRKCRSGRPRWCGQSFRSGRHGRPCCVRGRARCSWTSVSRAGRHLPQGGTEPCGAPGQPRRRRARGLHQEGLPGLPLQSAALTVCAINAAVTTDWHAQATAPARHRSRTPIQQLAAANPTTTSYPTESLARAKAHTQSKSVNVHVLLEIPVSDCAPADPGISPRRTRTVRPPASSNTQAYTAESPIPQACRTHP